MKSGRGFKISIFTVAIIVMFLILPKDVFAAITLSAGGNSSVNKGQTISIPITANPGGSTVGTISGVASSSNPSCLSITSVTGTNVNTNTVTEGIIASYWDTSLTGFSSQVTLLTITATAGNTAGCSANVIFTVDDDSVSDPTGDIRLVANDVSKSISVTAPVVKYNVTFNTGGGSSVATQQIVAGQTASRPNDPTRNGYTFNSWKLDSSEYDFSSAVNSNITLVADWTEVTKYNVTFSTGGGSSVSTQRVIAGQTASRPANPTRSGFTFEGWTLNGSTYNFSSAVNGNITLTAVWEEIVPVTPVVKDATLKALSITGHTLSPTFNKTVNSYRLTVNNDVTSLRITATATDSTARVETTGNSNFIVGVNNVIVKVTATDGTTNTYTISVTRKEKASSTTTNKTDTTTKTVATKSNDNFLKEMIITDGSIKPEFNQNISNYAIEVPGDIMRLNLVAVAKSSKATVKITGNENFKTDITNTVQINVTAEDGSIRIYTINVVKSKAKSNNKLSTLAIEGIPFTYIFESDVYRYRAKVPYKTNFLNIVAKSDNKTAKIEITGDKDLKEGNNTVIIKVTDENGFEQYYMIDVIRDKYDGIAILGIQIPTWLFILLFSAFPLLFAIILLIVARKIKPQNKQESSPTIEFNPVFNIGNPSDNNKSSDYLVGEARVKEIPFDPYDEIVTKDEIVDAIDRNDPQMLEILLKQDKLNKEKEQMLKGGREERLSRLMEANNGIISDNDSDIERQERLNKFREEKLNKEVNEMHSNQYLDKDADDTYRREW